MFMIRILHKIEFFRGSARECTKYAVSWWFFWRHEIYSERWIFISFFYLRWYWKKKQFSRKNYFFFPIFFSRTFFSLRNFLSLVFNKLFIRFSIIAQTAETLSAGNYEHHDNFCFHVKKFMCDISWSHFATHNLIDYMSFSNAGSSGENYVMVQWILIIK